MPKAGIDYVCKLLIIVSYIPESLVFNSARIFVAVTNLFDPYSPLNF